MNDGDFVFVPLGGVGHIGMNVSLYHYAGKWLMVDLGIGFAVPEDLPGMFITIPDVTFISERKEDLLGLVVTHGHEDHYGAVHYLWEYLGCPIYTGSLTANLIRKRFDEFNNDSADVPINIVKNGDELEIGPFSLKFIHVTHSVPETYSVRIKTDAGVAFHTGDWKFDYSPVVGNITDEGALVRVGDEGVDALICDSTNVFNPGKTGSEQDVFDGINRSVEGSSGIVVVTVFASNIARIKTVHTVASKQGRKVVLLGSSLIRFVSAAVESGCLEDFQYFSPQDPVITACRRNELLYIATGCQGEEMAAISKLARRQHSELSLAKGDTVIFSSKVIPGNERKIHDLFNMFVLMGVNLVTVLTDKVHVSGHPNFEDLRMLYSMIRPKLSVPVHGEYFHMGHHVKLAKDFFGVEDSVLVRLGEAVDLLTGDKVEDVQSGYLGVEQVRDRCFFHDPKSEVIGMRKRIGKSGIVVVFLLLDKFMKLVVDPVVVAPGAFDFRQDVHIMKEIVSEIKSQFFSKKSSGAIGSGRRLESLIGRAVSKMLKVYCRDRPFVEIRISRV